MYEYKKCEKGSQPYQKKCGIILWNKAEGGRNVGKKIAIIATDFLEQFIKDMITELDMGFQYHIFTYEKFEDIKDIYKKIGPEYDGILASGSFPAHMIHL